MTESPRNRAKCKFHAFELCFIAKESNVLWLPKTIYILSLTRSTAGHQRLAIAPRYDESPVTKSVRFDNHRSLLWENKLMSEFDAPLPKDDFMSPYGT